MDNLLAHFLEVESRATVAQDTAVAVVAVPAVLLANSLDHCLVAVESSTATPLEVAIPVAQDTDLLQAAVVLEAS